MQDIRLAIRSLRRNRLFSAAVILTFTIGLGATTAMLTLANTAWLGWSGAYRDADQLTMLQKRFRNGAGLTSPFDFRDWHDGLRSFESLAAYQRSGGRLATASEPAMVNTVLATATFFQVLGVQPALGRFFTRDEEQWGRHRVIVLSHATWQNAFAGDRAIIGRLVTLDDEPFQIIGVAPKGTWFGANPPALFAPLSFAPHDSRNSRNSHFIFTIGRLRTDVGLAAARAEARVLGDRIAQDHVENEATGIVIEPLEDVVLSDVKPTLRMVLWAVVLLLVTACANVANLMLVRGAARFREMAVRSALGASGGRILRQLLSESLVLAVAGGVLAVGLAQVILRVVGSSLPVSLPRVAESGLSIDWRIGALSLVVILASGILAGVLPGLQLARGASRRGHADALREGSRGSSGGRRAAVARSSLVIAQVSMGMVLLVMAGLFTRTIIRLHRVDAGVRGSEAVLTAFLPLPTARTIDSAAHARFFDETLRRVRDVPGITAAGVSSHLPLSGGGETKSFWIEGKEPSTNAEVGSVVGRMESARSRDALGLTLVRGRWFEESDRNGAPNVAVISEGVARKYFPGSDPIGQRISLHRPEALRPDATPVGGWPRWTVVGVVRDVKYASPREEPESAVYVHYPQGLQWWNWGPRWLVVRTTVDPTEIASPIRAALRTLDPTLPLTTMLPLDERMALSLRAPKFTAGLVTVFALVAVVLGALGLYGVIAYSVSQETRALGVRLAVGATAADISRHVLARGVRLGTTGIGLGLAGAYAATRLVSSQLFGVDAVDPLTYAAASGLLFGLTLLASYVPARRAGRVDPLQALRSD